MSNHNCKSQGAYRLSKGKEMAFRFESLEIWQLAIDFADHIYNLAEDFPKSEIFGLSSQFKRAVVSISNNIAEGSGANSPKDFRNYLDISIKSMLEVISMLFFAEKRNYIKSSARIKLYEEGECIIRKIRAFKKTLNKGE